MATLDVEGFFMDYPWGLWMVIMQLLFIVTHLVIRDGIPRSQVEKEENSFYAMNLWIPVFFLSVGILNHGLSGAVIVFEVALLLTFVLIIRKKIADDALRRKHRGY